MYIYYIYMNVMCMCELCVYIYIYLCICMYVYVYIYIYIYNEGRTQGMTLLDCAVIYNNSHVARALLGKVSIYTCIWYIYV